MEVVRFMCQVEVQKALLEISVRPVIELDPRVEPCYEEADGFVPFNSIVRTLQPMIEPLQPDGLEVQPRCFP